MIRENEIIVTATADAIKMCSEVFGAGSELKLAVIVPGPSTKAVVEFEESEANLIGPEEFQCKKVKPALGAADIEYAPESTQPFDAVAGLIFPPSVGFTAKTTWYCLT